MKKAESLTAIATLWLELPESDRHTLKFDTFYHQLEVSHPELLQWKNLSGRRDREVKAHLLNKNLMSIG